MNRTCRSLAAGALLAVAVACSDQSAPGAPTTVLRTSSTQASSTVPTSITTTSAVPPARYVVIGDFGGGSQAEYEVAAALEALVEEQPIDGLITTGDNFYTDDVEMIWTIPYGWLEEEGIPVYAAWGNHDLVSARRQALVEDHLRPAGRWYEQDLRPGTLIVLDSNDTTDIEQTTWLAETLEDADPPTIVAFHHPAFSCGMHGNTSSIIERWVPLIEDQGVDLVLSGHDHDYQRFEEQGVTYVVTGGGGQAIRPPGSCRESTPRQIAADNEHNHFMVLEVSADEIVGTTAASDGTIIDTFTVETRG